jgi:hypothetical protein
MIRELGNLCIVHKLKSHAKTTNNPKGAGRD